MSEEKLRLTRDELFTADVDQALAREHAGRERIVAAPPPVSAIRRLLLNSMFHLPLAAVIATLTCWLLLEPKIDDMPMVRGEILLIDQDPFDGGRDLVSITIGDQSIFVASHGIVLEAGADGQPALQDVSELKVGDRVEVAALTAEGVLFAVAIRPAAADAATSASEEAAWPMALLFPLTAALIAFGLLLAEGLTTRNWGRMVERTLLGGFLAGLFAVLAMIPAGLFMLISSRILNAQTERHSDVILMTVRELDAWPFFVVTLCRSAAWACIGAATGIGMNLVRSTRPQLRNSVIGGALGGAFGGLFFDPISRWIATSVFDGATISRLVGLLAVGLAIGVFVALVERMGREAWLRVRTGPLAGKSFILYKTPTVIGNAPASDVYLYKDANIDASHAQIHRVGTTYEIEDLGSRMGTEVGGTKTRRKRLVSGDQICIGATILDFEERQSRGNPA